MARPKQFDEDEVLDKAMMCFWEKGFEGASVRELEKATGISRISLYNTFQDKEHLFMAVQNKYHGIAEGYLNQMFFSDDSDIENLEGFFTMLGAKITDDTSPSQYGCMMVNTVLNVDSIGQDVVDNVKKYREMMVGKFRAFLERMQDSEKIRSDVDIEEAANYLLGSMWGVLAVNRLYGDPTQAQPQINIVLQTIGSWKAGGDSRV